MLKRKIDKAAYDALEEGQKALYKENGSGNYLLEVEDNDDGAELRRTLDKEREDRKALEKQLKDTNDRLARIEKEKADAERKRQDEEGDVASVRKSYEDKIAKMERDHAAELDQHRNTVTGLTSGAAAAKLAAELAVEGSASALEPHISRRLKTEYRDGKPVTVVLDAEGKPTALTLDELKEEIKSNKPLAPLIAGSLATGSGGASGKGGGPTSFDPKTATPAQKSAYISENGLAAWQKLVGG